MNKKRNGQWIWYYGDYEIYHYWLVHSRREDYGVPYPPFWTLSAPCSRVTFQYTYTAPKQSEVCVFSTAKGYVEMGFQTGDHHYNIGETFTVPAGEHHITVCVMKDGGLPSIFVDSEYLKTNDEWMASDGTKRFFLVGTDAFYSSLSVTPETFPFTYERLDYIEAKEEKGGWLFDFAKEIFAKLHIEPSALVGEYQVVYGESREEALDRENAVLRETITASGAVDLRARGFRYVWIEGKSKPLVYVELELPPHTNHGSFKCDRALVNDIYSVSAYTLSLCSREFFMDGIKRDRWVWAGDAYQSAMIAPYQFTDSDITRRTILALLSKPPYTQHINTINDYTLYLILMAEAYYAKTHDRIFLNFAIPKLCELYAFFLTSLTPDGFAGSPEGDWVFIDWAEGLDKEGPVCTLQIILWAAASAMSRLYGCINQTEAAKEATRFAQNLKARIDACYWDETKGGYVNSFVSGKRQITRHANIFAIIFDFADETRKQRILSYVLLNDAIPAITTPYFKFFEYDARCRMGQMQAVQEEMEAYWGGMLRLGATSIWETFDPLEKGAEHYAMYGQPFSRSLCHAWGAGPVYLLGRYCMGIHVKEDGNFVITPNPGSYKCFEGIVPLAGGEISIKYEYGRYEILASGSGVLVLNEKTYEIKAGKKLLIT